MYLTRHQTEQGARWALDGRFLPQAFSLDLMMQLPADRIRELLMSLSSNEPARGVLLPPIESFQEVWGAGVTYLRSRQARMAESSVSSVYDMVYAAERPEIFFKAIGWRVIPHQMPIRIRRDSKWNVPEPEMTLVINHDGGIVGFCVGDDVSSRDIEGENPLYLPQAKIYNGSCALGPGILLQSDNVKGLAVQISILRSDETVFQGDTRTSNMKRPLDELIRYLWAELDFHYGAFLMTGTGIVPPDTFTLHPGDKVRITIGALMLENPVGE